MNATKDNRKIYLDLLRILASVAVVAIHSIGKWCGGHFSARLMWTVLYDGLARWAVPVFVMISGALLLRNSEIEFAEIKRRIFKLIKLFLIWSFLLIAYEIFYLKNYQAESDIIARICSGGHLYYLYIAAGLYLVLPFLNFIYQNETLSKYFLVLWMIFTFIIPRSLYYISWYFNKEGFANISSALEFVLDISSIHMPVGYSGYFILGGVLNRRQMSFKKGILFFSVGAAITVGGTLGYTLVTRQAVSLRLFDYFAVNTLLMSIGIFIIAKQIGKGIERLNSVDTIKKWLYRLSSAATGVYCLHPIVINTIDFPERVVYFFPLLTIPMVVMLNWTISLVIVAILKKLPITKHIV